MASKTSVDAANAANAKALHFLGGFWKCEECGLLIEDELFVCPECNAVKLVKQDKDNDGKCKL